MSRVVSVAVIVAAWMATRAEATSAAIYALNHAPFYDTCNGKLTSNCMTSPGCFWSVAFSPNCVNTVLPSRTPPRVDPYNLVLDFFKFSWGVHLTEGATTRTYYNSDLVFCARECIRSSGGLVSLNGSDLVALRCLSFDFYPFEFPNSANPLLEGFERGICTLNSESADTARLRNEDEGFTQAEWYYQSHFTKRPFSPLSGYYEVRDPRGGALANFLQYAGNPLTGLQSVNHVWGQSRWGIFHYRLPPVSSALLDCSTVLPDQGLYNTGNGSDLVYSGGFCPVAITQHCTGLITKADATALCATAGGRLCYNAAEAALISGAKTGCNYDGWPVWTADMPDSNPNAFPRCCADYSQPINCQAYSQANVNFCTSLPTASSCITAGSSVRMQATWGMGNRLAQFRETCVEWNNATGVYCRNLLVSDWQASDMCIWCPTAGEGPSGGAGKCLPGSDFGICPQSGALTQESFAQRMKAGCSSKAICNLVTHPGFSFLQGILGVPTQAPTYHPSNYPTSPTTTASPTVPGCSSIFRKTSCTPAHGCTWLGGKCVTAGSNTPSAKPVSAPTTTKAPSAFPSTQPTAPTVATNSQTLFTTKHE